MRIAIHLHLHYLDLLDSILSYLRNVPYNYDMLISVTDAASAASVKSVCKRVLPGINITVLAVENKGRDVKPFYTDFADIISTYDYVCHIHGKKSLFNGGATTGWLEYLLDALMGSKENVRQFFDTFENSPGVGLIYPANFYQMPYWANAWLSNKGYAAKLQQLLKIKELPNSFFPFPVGNMFWARVDAIRPLFDLKLTAADYPPEAGQRDGEIMHALERITSVLSKDRGYENLIIEKKSGSLLLRNDGEGVDLSGYFSSSLQDLKKMMDDPAIRVVSFDIFDTLICRKVLQPTDVFEHMQTSFEQCSGSSLLFKDIRQQADAKARASMAHGKDVKLQNIYEAIEQHWEISKEDCSKLLELELSLETKLMEKRHAVSAMLDYAWETGKRVILTSDMYLAHDALTNLLQTLGITNYHQLYVSSSVGLRKDNRQLFPHILSLENCTAAQMLHIGDNEHSDLQIPGDSGIRTFHVMRPTALFAHTAWGQQSLRQRTAPMTVFENRSLAMSLNKIFDNPFPKGDSFINGDLHLFGYYYFGTTLLAFVKWVADCALKDGVERLCFLARDGELLYKIYLLLKKYSKEPLPEAKYIEVSRRSLDMALISTPEELDKMLTPDFFHGSLHEYFMVRMNIDLSQFNAEEITRFGFSSINDSVTAPADLDKIKMLASYLFETCLPWFTAQQELALAYLNGFHFFDDAKKAVVDIGYSGTMQNLLNQVAVDPVDGYYMITHQRIDTSISRAGAAAKGFFGDRLNPLNNNSAMNKYSLFYEMILSSVKGTVVHYNPDSNGSIAPVYERVHFDETKKIKKLPVIHAGVLDFCNEYLAANGASSVIWNKPEDLYAPFIYFLEHPMQKDVEMMTGYSIDDTFCGNGILHWFAPPEFANSTAGDRNNLWKHMVQPFRVNGPEQYFGRPPAQKNTINKEESEIREWYEKQYDALPGWYKSFGHVFKLIKKKKKFKITLADIDYPLIHNSKADELRAWYNKEYEVLPLWYKRCGHLIQVVNGTKKWSDLR